jgi:hypothetical protein
MSPDLNRLTKKFRSGREQRLWLVQEEQVVLLRTKL